MIIRLLFTLITLLLALPVVRQRVALGLYNGFGFNLLFYV
ncbi:hypothetical protein ABIE12_000582 [Serratia sp. 509]